MRERAIQAATLGTFEGRLRTHRPKYCKPNSLGDRLTLTQNDLVKRLGVSRNMMQNWESRPRRCRAPSTMGPGRAKTALFVLTQATPRFHNKSKILQNHR
jgi:hypothetical protein